MALALSRDTRITGLATLTSPSAHGAPDLGAALAHHQVGELAPHAALGLQPNGPMQGGESVQTPQGERSFRLECKARPADPHTVLDGDSPMGVRSQRGNIPAATPGTPEASRTRDQALSREPGPERSSVSKIDHEAPKLATGTPERTAGPKAERDLPRTAAVDRQALLTADRSPGPACVPQKELSPAKVAELKQSEFRSPIYQWLERVSRSTAAQTVVGAVAGYVLSAQMGNPSWKWALAGTAAALGGGWLLNKYLMDKKTMPGWTLADTRKY